jgi:signal transduction histidine kinase
MVAYNVQSLFVFYSLASLLGGVMAFFYLRNLDTSARYWAVAALIAGVTNLATVFRAELPLLWSYSIPIGLTGTVFVLMGLGIERLHRQGPHGPALLALAIGTALFIALMEWSRIHMGPRVTVVLSGGLFALTSFWGSYTAHVYHRLSGNRFARHLCTVMIGIGVVNVLRTQSTFTGWGLETFGADAWTLGIWSTMFLLGMVRYVMYIALRIQQHADERSQAAVALAREQENRRLGTQLAQLERQQSLGVMSASFAHELNQPLASILNYAELLQTQQRSGQLDTPSTPLVLQEIVDSSLRAGAIIHRIRGFIQPEVLEKDRFDMRKVVDEVCALVAPEARRQDIRVIKAAMSQPVWVQADAVQMSQVLFNLVRNGMESVASAKVREVRVALTQRDQEVHLSVQDTGPGLTTEAAKQAGDPFFTTKISGLGMGLSISKTILGQYDGRLSLTNVPGQGVCALVCLPVASVSSAV